MNKLLLVFIVFAVIDLIFVGTTCLHVVKYLKQIVRELKNIGEK